MLHSMSHAAAGNQPDSLKMLWILSEHVAMRATRKWARFGAFFLGKTLNFQSWLGSRTRTYKGLVSGLLNQLLLTRRQDPSDAWRLCSPPASGSL
jgi:hypothetical protein